jgi:ATP-dependent RNA helicase DDX55/SPB4
VPLTRPEINISDKFAKEITQRMRKEVLSDRAIHDKGQRAFVSWVKSYSKHQASSIFRIEDADWTDLGHAWALLRLPKMPELKKWDGDKSLGVGISMAEYAYKDKARENARIEAEKEKAAAGPYVPTEEQIKKRKERMAWSQKHEKHELKEERRERKKRKTEAERKKTLSAEELEKEKELQSLLVEVRRKTKEEEAKRRAEERAERAAERKASGKGGDEEEFEGFD